MILLVRLLTTANFTAGCTSSRGARNELVWRVAVFARLTRFGSILLFSKYVVIDWLSGMRRLHGECYV